MAIQKLSYNGLENWRKLIYAYGDQSDTEQKNIRDFLTEYFEYADQKVHPGYARYLQNASELGAGEIWDRSNRELGERMLSKDGAYSVYDELYAKTEALYKMDGLDFNAIMMEEYEQEELKKTKAELYEYNAKKREEILASSGYQSVDQLPAYLYDEYMKYADDNEDLEDDDETLKNEQKNSKISADVSQISGVNGTARPVPEFGMLNSIADGDDGYNFDDPE